MATGGMHWVGLAAGALLVLAVLWEAFETIVFPRRVTRRFRFTRAFYRATWLPLRAYARRRKPEPRRDGMLSVYGPLSLLLLLMLWAVLLVLGFALMQWGAGTRLQTPEGLHGYVADLYFSGATLFTLSLGDIMPVSRFARLLTVVEGGDRPRLLRDGHRVPARPLTGILATGSEHHAARRARRLPAERGGAVRPARRSR